MTTGSLKRGFTARQAEVAEFRVLRVPWFVFPLGARELVTRFHFLSVFDFWQQTNLEGRGGRE